VIFLILLIFLAILFILLLAVCIYFFFIAFVRMNTGDLENIDDIGNKPLWDYRDVISIGLNYIKTRNARWVNTLSYDGLTLKARYFDNGHKNTIILFHGYRSAAARDFSCAVKMYTQLGFNVLLVDQRSHGKSEGKLITFGIKESRDVISWIRFTNESLKAENVVLGGMSMGATTVLLACVHRLPENVRCIIADSGFTSPVDIINKVARQYFRVNAKLFIPILNLFCLLFGKFSLFSMNTVDSLKKSNLPVLFIHGKIDTFVPCEMSVTNHNSIKDRSELLIVENANHGMGFLVEPEKVYNTLKKFLEKHCKL